MIFSLFFFLGSLETFLLAAYLVSVGSTEPASILFNLSLSRLAVVLISTIIGCVFLYYAFRSITHQGTRDWQEKQILDNEKRIWILFFSGLTTVCLAILLLTRQINDFGDIKLIYQRLEPVLVWAAVIGVQVVFFAAVWHSAKFIRDDSECSSRQIQRELIPLFGLFAVFLGLKLAFVSATSYGPLGRGDEMTYFDMADSFYRGFFSARESNHYPPLYPLTLVPTLVFKAWTFEGIKLINAIFSSSLVFPVYFISRNFLDSRKSLMAAILSCLIPYHLVFPRRILSENLFFPLFLWAMYATQFQPKNEKFRLIWDVLNGAIIAALYLTRYITLATIPFFLLAWWIKPFPEKKTVIKFSSKKLYHWLGFIAAMLAVFSPWLIAGMREGVPIKLMLGFGIASRTTLEQLTLPKLMAWVVLYACYYILVAAPVFHLLIMSFWQINVKGWRNGIGRWIFQVLLVMGGFYAAVTRHSWRAYYNADLPAAIMGRYLIVFSAVYFIIALAAIENYHLSRFRSRFQQLLFSLILPLGLVAFAYFTLIQGAIIPTDGDLLKSLGSVDGFFTEILGPYFFLLIFLIYLSTYFLLIKGRKVFALSALLAGLIVYYAAGVPAYYRDLMAYQTYPWLAKQVSRLMPPPDLKSGDAERITVFLPVERTAKNEAEMYNGLRTHGIQRSIIEPYSKEAVEKMETERGFVIESLGGTEAAENQPVYEINGLNFKITPVSK